MSTDIRERLRVAYDEIGRQEARIRVLVRALRKIAHIGDPRVWEGEHVVVWVGEIAREALDDVDSD